MSDLKAGEAKSKGGVMITLFVFLAFIFSVVSLGATAYFYFVYEKQQGHQSRLEATQRNLKEENRELEGKSVVLQKKLEQALSELDQLRDYKENSGKDKQALEQALNLSYKDLATTKSQQKLDRARLSKLESMIATKNEVIQSLKSKISGFQGELDNVRNLVNPNVDVPQPPATVPVALPTQVNTVAPPAASASDYYIKSVNRKFNFVVISTDANARIDIGDTFQVYRSGNSVGEITIQRVYDRFASAKIIQEFNDLSIEKGDEVRKN